MNETEHLDLLVMLVLAAGGTGLISNPEDDGVKRERPVNRQQPVAQI